MCTTVREHRIVSYLAAGGTSSWSTKSENQPQSSCWRPPDGTAPLPRSCRCWQPGCARCASDLRAAPPPHTKTSINNKEMSSFMSAVQTWRIKPCTDYLDVYSVSTSSKDAVMVSVTVNSLINHITRDYAICYTDIILWSPAIPQWIIGRLFIFML